MNRFVALAAIALSIFANAEACADPARVKVADGAVSFVVPAGWVHDKEPGFVIYIEPTLQDEDWSRCAVKVQKGPNPQGLDQETFNAQLAKRTAKNILSPGDDLISFSNTGFVGSSRVLAFSYVSERGTAFNVRQFMVVEGKSATVIQADCVTADPEAADPAFVKGSTAFLNSAAIDLR